MHNQVQRMVEGADGRDRTDGLPDREPETTRSDAGCTQGNDLARFRPQLVYGDPDPIDGAGNLDLRIPQGLATFAGDQPGENTVRLSEQRRSPGENAYALIERQPASPITVQRGRTGKRLFEKLGARRRQCADYLAVVGRSHPERLRCGFPPAGAPRAHSATASARSCRALNIRERTVPSGQSSTSLTSA